jgi:chemotaxis protein CheX
MHVVSLPEKCDRVAAHDLAQQLRGLIGQGEITIDGTAVRQVGQAMLQTLVSARLSTGHAGQQLSITASDQMRRICRMTALEQHILKN